MSIIVGPFFKLVVAALSGLLTALVTLALGWRFGSRVSVEWAIRQKHRESRLAAAEEFYRLYGEFIGVWKDWKYSLLYANNFGWGHPGHTELLRRACTAEGNFEAIMVKLASEQQLSADEQEALGQFRQAYQTIRESIGTAKPITWGDDRKQPDPAYEKFKKLSSRLASILADDKWTGLPKPNEVYDALTTITSRTWDGGKWVDADLR